MDFLQNYRTTGTANLHIPSVQVEESASSSGRPPPGDPQIHTLLSKNIRYHIGTAAKLPEVKYHLLSFFNPFSLSFFLSIRPHKYIIPVHGYAANCNLYSPSSQLILFRKNRAACISSVFPETVSVTFPELVIFTIPYSASKNNPQAPYHIYQILNTLFIQNNEFAFL